MTVNLNEKLTQDKKLKEKFSEGLFLGVIVGAVMMYIIINVFG